MNTTLDRYENDTLRLLLGSQPYGTIIKLCNAPMFDWMRPNIDYTGQHVRVIRRVVDQLDQLHITRIVNQ